MSNIKVCVKIRPQSQRDIKLKKEEEWKVIDDQSLQCVNTLHPCDFTFDRIFGPKSLNYEVYASFVKPIVESCLIGFNGTILTYGPTSAGKNYTMLGADHDPGIILISIERLFKTGGYFHRTIRFGYIEIYKEKIFDLLNDRKQILIDRNQNDTTISNEEIVVESFEKAVETLFNGSYKRKSAAEDSTKLSNVSHSIFKITIESEDKTKGKTQISHLRFVHVAGCEPMTEPTDSLEDESNKSLYWFNAVIDGLDKGETNINFNHSILTTLLRESLAGSSNTAIVCNIRADEAEESISTLNFVSRAKNVRTLPMRNEMHNTRARSSRCSTPVESKMSSTPIKMGSTPVRLSSRRSAPVDSKLDIVEHQLKEMANVKVENLFLRKEVEEVKAAFAAKTKWFQEQMQNAEFAQQKLEHAQIEQKKSSERIENGLRLRVKNLTSSNRYLLGKLEEFRKDPVARSPLKPNESSILSQTENSTLTGKGGKYAEKQPVDLDVATGIKRKIERLENDLAKTVKKLKDELQCEKNMRPRIGRIRPLYSDGTVSHTITVPNYLIGRVIGPGGDKMRSVYSTTGARIDISERKGNSDRTVAITGVESSVDKAVDKIRQMLEQED